MSDFFYAFWLSPFEHKSIRTKFFLKSSSINLKAIKNNVIIFEANVCSH